MRMAKSWIFSPSVNATVSNSIRRRRSHPSRTRSGPWYWTRIASHAALADPFDGSGMSMFTASLVLGIMILPTIITVSKTSLDAVPGSYYEGSLALGATHERSVFTIMLPAAKSGVLSAIILGVGRAIGETMAVIMVAGNQPIMPSGLFEGLRTMTSNIVLEMGYATGLHRQALIATGVVLFVFILLINLCFSLVKGGKKDA